MHGLIGSAVSMLTCDQSSGLHCALYCNFHPALHQDFAFYYNMIFAFESLVSGPCICMSDYTLRLRSVAVVHPYCPSQSADC